MSHDLEWIDARGAIQTFLNGTEHCGHRIRARYEQTADAYGQPVDAVPEVIIYPTGGGTIEWVDRTDELTLEVYAPRGELAVRIAESVLRMIAGPNLETPEGFLDLVKVRSTPADIPYQSEHLSKAMTTISVVSRPL